MSYEKIWQKALGPGERIEYEFSLSNTYLNLVITFWGIIGLATVWIYGLGAVIFFTALFYYGFYMRAAHAFAFTNKRILIHRGWISTSMVSVDYSRVTDMYASENIIERWFLDIGTLSVNTAGTSLSEVALTHISKPYAVKQKLAELIEKDEKADRTFVAVNTPTV